MKPKATRILLSVWFACLSLFAQAQWTTYAPMPTARWGNSSVGYNGLLYSISGSGTTVHQVYNPVTNTWASLAAIPTEAAYAAVSAWNGRLYVMGGSLGSTWLNTNQIYDIATNTWSAGAPLPVNTMGATSVAYNGRIYVAGGWNGALINNLQIYDIATNTWTAGAAAPTNRYEACAGLIGTRMYVFGGYTSSPITLVEAYDILTNTWQTRASMNTARYIFAGASDGSLLHAAGGFPNTGTYETYDPVSNTWTIRPSLTQARYRVSGGVANACFFVVGGFNGTSTVATNEGTCGLTILPVDASLQLAARVREAAVHLTWQHDAATPTYNWQLQRSADGVDFTAIAQVGEQYSHWDEAPLPGRNYYRLVRYDGNGELVQSEVVLADLTDRAAYHFSYHSATATLTFHLHAMAQGKAALYDLSGKRLLAAELPAAPSAEPLVWSLADLPDGVYVFSYQSGLGAFQRKVIKVD